MTIRLSQLHACFEGVIPSIIATAAADGMPNVSYLSHVAMVDENHIALSNQFFAKTSANVRANPKAAVVLVDGRTGQQFALDVVWDRVEDRGRLFEHMERDLRASSTQLGWGDVMRLRAVDVFRVLSIRACEPEMEVAQASPVAMADIAEVARRIGSQQVVEGVLDALLEGVTRLTGATAAMVLLPEPARATLVVTGLRGYADGGIGSEVPVGEGLIGEAAAARVPLRINDVTRVHRLSGAVSNAADSEDRTRTIALPVLEGGMSQIAAPMLAAGELRGVLFAEARERLAFDAERQAVIETLAVQAAMALTGVAQEEAEPVLTPIAPPNPEVPSGQDLVITTFAFDDSIFINNRYVIKGVAGRLLKFMLERAIAENRVDFSNREIRLSSELRLPEFKDNLEARLLLLRRRLSERSFGIDLVQTGRGQLRLHMDGRPVMMPK
ncbi:MULTISPECIES: GAF domain-containing protein [Asticcacaulis]|uniref:GAF domain-containing protein n=1 Tax=Asticcacaulis TaxID=76890 RepID=UPI001AEB5984|nr:MULTISPECIES: GAF domain-containing protein [Asticcacaulis]MBP2160453.1 adenylate cyclase [Asticcacaulis solisilvae]MDR6801498.1 adenylate cyclase [Asticcacaulis sp. BE141]